MKLLLVAYGEAVDEDVMEALRGVGVAGYTKWTGVLGEGQSGGPHLLSHVWPKGNCVLVAAVDDAVAAAALGAIRGLRQTAGREGVKAFLLPVEEIT